MKKYIFIMMFIFTEHQFFAASQEALVMNRSALVQRWKNAETMAECYRLFHDLAAETKEQLLLDLIDEYQGQLIQSLKENNFLYFIRDDFYKNIIPHSRLFEYFWRSPVVVQKILRLFNNFYTADNMIHMNTVNQNLDRYYFLLDRYAQAQDETLQIVADKKDIIELLQKLLKDQGNQTLPGNFAKADSLEQKALKKYLLEKERDLILHVAPLDQGNDEIDRFTAVTESDEEA